MIESLVYSYDVYKDLLDKQQKGMEFYEKLGASVTALLERTRRLCKTQQEERKIISEKMKGELVTCHCHIPQVKRHPHNETKR